MPLHLFNGKHIILDVDLQRQTDGSEKPTSFETKDEKGSDTIYLQGTRLYERHDAQFYAIHHKSGYSLTYNGFSVSVVAKIPNGRWRSLRRSIARHELKKTSTTADFENPEFSRREADNHAHLFDIIPNVIVPLCDSRVFLRKHEHPTHANANRKNEATVLFKPREDYVRSFESRFRMQAE